MDKFIPKEEWPSQVRPNSTDSELLRCGNILRKWINEDKNIDVDFDFFSLYKAIVSYIEAYKRNGIEFDEYYSLICLKIINDILLFLADRHNREIDDYLIDRDYENARNYIKKKYHLEETTKPA